MILRVRDENGNVREITVIRGPAPVRGEDYWTPEDQAAIVSAVLAEFVDVSEVGM